MPRAPRIAIIGGGIGGLGRGAGAGAARRRGHRLRAGAGAQRDRRRAQSHAQRGQGVPRARPRRRDRSDRLGPRNFQLIRSWKSGPLHFAHPPRRFPPEIRRAESHRAPRRSARRAARRAQVDRDPARQALPSRRDRRARRGGALCRRQRRSRPISWSAPTASIPWCAKSLFGADAPRFTGCICWRGMAPVDARAARHQYRGRHHVDGPARPCRALPRAPRRTPQHRRPSRQRRLDRGILDARMRRCGSDGGLCRLASGADPLYPSSTRWYKWALYDRDPLPRWSKGRATLLGDSAHAMLPYLGQGAAMAIEDGCVLAAMVARHADDLDAALARLRADAGAARDMAPCSARASAPRRTTSPRPGRGSSAT